MANVMLATRQTATDVLSTVSVITGTITAGSRSIENLARVAEANSAAYLDNVQADIAENAARRKTLRIFRAKEEISLEILAIQQRLNKDPELAHIFNNIDDNLSVNVTTK
jgi:proline dehydrogenase